jgi:HD-like signal output (HDOD) protein
MHALRLADMDGLRKSPGPPIPVGMDPQAKAPDPATQAPRRDRLEHYVTQLVGDSKLPLFSKRLLDILALGTQDRTSAHKLADLVMEDYALTVNVLRMANSFAYNRSNRAIENVSHAIVVLGMDTVRKLASTLVYFLAFENRSASLRELMVQSMLSAHAAGLAADKTGFPRREDAYLAAMLLNLGEVLVACHSPEHYLVIRGEAREGTPMREACQRRLGFSFDAVAKAIGRQWRLAPELAAIWDESGAPPQLAALARFGNELTRVMYRPSTKHEAGIKLLMFHYGYTLKLKEDDVPALWERAVEETRTMFGTLGVMVGSHSSLSLPTS